MNVLVLEPWYGGSHRRFLDGLVAHSAHDVRAVTMAARYWKWRMQGAAVTLAEKARAILEGGWRPDVIVATGMVNVPAFLALTRDVFGGTPVVMYLHENQLTYPLRDGDERDYTYAWINYLSALASDRVVFNSQFHHDEFFGALPDLLRRFPDYAHLGALAGLRAKSSVLHLGLDLAGLDAARPAAEAQRSREPGPPVILWNHRWEYDKNPQAFFRAINRLDDTGERFRLILAGKTFAEQPPAFQAGFSRYAERVLHYGYAESFQEYAALLWRSDVVVSTSVHEFFGVSMLEAIHCGCHPLLPDRLTYPELIPDRLHAPLLHAPVLYDGEDVLFDTLRSIVRGDAHPLPADVLRDIPSDFAWPLQAPRFDALFEDASSR
ncbi:tRNA-queuosine alpha-mannosyltransferase domain-containing protein [Rubrivirga sp.]|uniref:tRNA-queuosine alpha-mannosyltransferase domain-containing protein n=1 Tax=Rubrivirga sp. TaxID=1885344 RepID=UPI003C73B782